MTFSGSAPTHKKKNHYAVDQVSRILHTQNSMKSFLGAMSKPATPNVVLSSKLSNAGGRKDQGAHGSAELRSSSEPRHTLRHTSFKVQVKNPNVCLVCSMCAAAHCSVDMRYLGMPMLAKPWIPVCAACHRAHMHSTDSSSTHDP